MIPSRFHTISPFLGTDDLPATLAFYQEKLGFDLAWEWGSPLEVAAVCRDQVEITLTCRSDARPGGISRIYIGIDAIDDYHAHLLQAGVTIDVPIDDRPYGMRDFSVVDPTGNVLTFGQPLPQPQPTC
ncbi:glyoxalase superfamily protein [Stenotrophomonas humi]|uniref:glyoxalase superfamily protein n=1 Tax=Stenotrophomonas humi TaxID=405444 RepID=UPI00070BB0AC|nr:glyoxalase superfamily protein [Stenotrophomonas humi]